MCADLRDEIFILEHIKEKNDKDLFPFDLSAEQPSRCGMLIGESLFNTLEIAEIRGLLNLYSDIFLDPLYKVDRFGSEHIVSLEKALFDMFEYWRQDKVLFLLTKDF